VVEIFGTTTVDDEPPDTPVPPAAASCGPPDSERFDAAAASATDPVTDLSGTLNGTSARALTLPEFVSTSSSLTR
jgi:hypothetical protein